MNPNWQHTDPLAVQKRSQGVDQRQARKNMLVITRGVEVRKTHAVGF